MPLLSKPTIARRPQGDDGENRTDYTHGDTVVDPILDSSNDEDDGDDNGNSPSSHINTNQEEAGSDIVSFYSSSDSEEEAESDEDDDDTNADGALTSLPHNISLSRRALPVRSNIKLNTSSDSESSSESDGESSSDDGYDDEEEDDDSDETGSGSEDEEEGEGDQAAESSEDDEDDKYAKDDDGSQGSSDADVDQEEENDPWGGPKPKYHAGGEKYYLEYEYSEGRFGTIDKVINEDGHEFAVKKAKEQGMDQSIVEGDALEAAFHENVVLLYERFLHEGMPCLLLEFCPHGNLFDVMLDRGRLDELEVRQIGRAIAEGVNHIHCCGFIHRDLKPENVVFGEGMTPKVIDLGLALRYRIETASGIWGTHQFIAPEVIKMRMHTTAMDIWVVGALIFFMMFGRPPELTKERQLTDESMAYLDDGHISAQAKDVLERTLAANSDCRIIMRNLLLHPFLQIPPGMPKITPDIRLPRLSVSPSSVSPPPISPPSVPSQEVPSQEVPRQEVPRQEVPSQEVPPVTRAITKRAQDTSSSNDDKPTKGTKKTKH